MQPQKVTPPSRSPRRHQQRSRPSRGPSRLGGTATQLVDERELRWYFHGLVGGSSLAAKRAHVRAARVAVVLASLAESVRSTLATAFGPTPVAHAGWGLRGALGAAWPAVATSPAVVAVGGPDALEAMYEVARRKAIGAGSKALRMAAFLVVRTSIVLEVRAALKAYRRALVSRERRVGGGR